MLWPDHVEHQIASRLLDFFAEERAWQRRLWGVGTCLTLRELGEAANAEAGGALSAGTVRFLQDSARELAGPDPGVGELEQRKALMSALRADLIAGGFSFRLLEELTHKIQTHYLLHWSEHLARPETTVQVERFARGIASHLLAEGFSAEYLHRWWSYRIRHEGGKRRMSELVEEAHVLARTPLSNFSVLVPFSEAARGARAIPGWISSRQVKDWLTARGATEPIRQAGGLLIEIEARDPGAAVQYAADTTDRHISRVTLGSPRAPLRHLDKAWVAERPTRGYPLRRRRQAEIPVLYRRDEPLAVIGFPQVDSALELLAPVDRGPAVPAVAGAWAAIESLLSAPGDEGRVTAGDRLASLVACSFPRGELTTLAYRYQESNQDSFAGELSRCVTNTARCALLAERVATGEDLIFTNPSDQAAVDGLRRLFANPTRALRRIESHLIRALRRLYRVRNLALHWGATESVALKATLRTTPPLVGAGIDRVVRGALIKGIEPLDLAVRARLQIDLASRHKPSDFADLLQLAE